MIDESKLVFIISQPRSGSTMLQKLVSNNEYVDTVSEPWLLLPLLSVYRPELIQAKYNYRVAMKGFNDYLQKKDATDEFRTELKKLILGLYKMKSDSHYFIDKTPRYYEILPEIASFFPGAKFLVLKRNLFASLNSMLTTWSKGKVDYVDFERYYRDFLSAPFLIQEFCETHGNAPNVMVVKYEEVLATPETKVKEMYEWLGIPFNADVLQVEKNEKVKGIFGDDVYKKKPLEGIKSNHSDSWRENLSNKEFRRLFAGYQEFLTPDFIRRYGYEPETIGNPGFRLGGSAFHKYVDTLRKEGKI